MPETIIHPAGVVDDGDGPAAEAEPQVHVAALQSHGQEVPRPLVRAARPHQEPVRVPGPKLQLYAVGAAAQSAKTVTGESPYFRSVRVSIP